MSTDQSQRDEAVADTKEPAELVDLLEPQDGVPDVLTTWRELEAAAAALSAGEGPVAADAERASGYRYGQHNYLVQLRREGAGTFLIDPIALPDLSIIDAALRDAEWVFHASSQDLIPLREQQLFPERIFDTELAARLLGMARVGLSTVVAELLGLRLAKEHSAVDWSIRPLLPAWLQYAALDVEVLVELRNILKQQLIDAGKLAWAEQEFEAVRRAEPPEPRQQPWRRISHLGDVKGRRGLAVARELWLVRENNAQQRDISPGRVLPDRAIVKAAQVQPKTIPDLLKLSEFAGKAAKSRAPLWLSAINRALVAPDDELPSTRGPAADGPPQPRLWKDRAPKAAARWATTRPAMIARAEELQLPVENLLQPDLVRRLCWDDSVGPDEAAEFLQSRGARPWQIEQSLPTLQAALRDAVAELD